MARKNKVEKSGQSPYQRHAKAPFRYSEIYARWREAVREGRTAETRRLAEQHTERWLGDFIRERDAA